MNVDKVREQKLQIERDAIYSALVTTETQRAAAKVYGCSASSLHVMLARHPGLVEKAKAARAEALAKLAVKA